MTAIADDLVDRFHVHPDDAVELIDMHAKVVYAAIERGRSDQQIAEALFRQYEKLAMMTNPISTPALGFGMIFVSVGIGAYLIARALRSPPPSNAPSDPTILV